MTTILVAALLPCIILLYFVYKKDKIEPEPRSILIKLFFLGCLSTIPAILLEYAGAYVLAAVGITGGMA